MLKKIILIIISIVLLYNCLDLLVEFNPPTRYWRRYSNADQYSYQTSFRIPNTIYYGVLTDTTISRYKDVYLSKDSIVLANDKRNQSVTHIRLYKYDIPYHIYVSQDTILVYDGWFRSKRISGGDSYCEFISCRTSDLYEAFLDNPNRGPALWYLKDPYVKISLYPWNNQIDLWEREESGIPRYIRINGPAEVVTYSEHRQRKHMKHRL